MEIARTYGLEIGQEQEQLSRKDTMHVSRVKQLSLATTNHAVCFRAWATFLVDNELLSGEDSLSECIRTRQLDAASLNSY